MTQHLLSDLAAVLAPSLLITLVGYLWGRSARVFDQDFVTRLVTNVGAPCLVFSALTKTPLPGREVLAMSGATLVCLAIFAVVGTAVLSLVRLSVRTYLPSVLFPNIGNMGLPICLFAFGERGLTLATVYFAATTVCQFTAGPAIAAGRFDPGFLLRVPFLYAVAAALTVGGFGVGMPQWVVNTASLAGGLTIPLMLLALGVALARLTASSLPRALGLSVLRIGLGVAVGFGVAHLFGFAGAERGVLVIQSAMPTAVFNYLFARLYRTEPEEIAGVVLVSTMLSYATLPVLVALVL